MLQKVTVSSKYRHDYDYFGNHLSNCLPSLVWTIYSWLYGYLSCLSKYKNSNAYHLYSDIVLFYTENHFMENGEFHFDLTTIGK